jgi:DNA-binding Lrp family transcriptional regulator
MSFLRKFAFCNEISRSFPKREIDTCPSLYSTSENCVKINQDGKTQRGSCLRRYPLAPKRGATLKRNSAPPPFEDSKEEEEPMAIAAYIFIETMQGKAKTISRQIGAIPGVKTAHTVTGPYDVITYVEADSLLTLGDFIVSKIQAIPGVLRTLTNVIIDG